MTQETLRETIWSLIESVPYLLTLALAAYAGWQSRKPSFQETELLQWLLTLVVLLTSYELVQRFRRLRRIEQQSRQTLNRADEVRLLLAQVPPRLVEIPTLDCEDETRTLIGKYTVQLQKPHPTGHRRYLIQYFVDFKDVFSKVSGHDLCQMALILASAIRQEGCHFTRIVSPPGIKFGDQLGEFLGVPYVVVGSPIDGKDFTGQDPSSQDKVILVWDLSLSGYSLWVCIPKITQRGATVKHAFVLVERTDGALSDQRLPSELLKERGVTLHSCVQVSDQELEKMYEFHMNSLHSRILP